MARGRWGELLRTVVPDFLAGGDAALAEGEAVIRKRAAANPQELTVWLPSDASEADEADARAKCDARGSVASRPQTPRAAPREFWPQSAKTQKRKMAPQAGFFRWPKLSKKGNCPRESR